MVSLFFFTSVLNQIIQALNVVIRMQPKLLYYPFNVRPFFTDRETKDIGPDFDLCKFNIRSYPFFVNIVFRPRALSVRSSRHWQNAQQRRHLDRDHV
jgi:hypothetical protein